MILIDGRSLSLEQLVSIADDRTPVGVSPDAAARVRAARAVVEAKAEGETPVYGINTGFGSFAEVKSRAPPSNGCSSTSCAVMPPASASRCRFAACAR